MPYLKPTALGAAMFLLAAAMVLHAEVKLPAIFGDHMVLQEGMNIPVWGTADPHETVTVTIGKETAQGKAGADGKWRITLAPIAANSAPQTMIVTGKNSLTFTDVLVGEVWICSGQSNMEFNLGGAPGSFGGAHNATAILPQASDPQLRFFRVTKKPSFEPLNDVEGKWEVCTPDSASAFSAVGYFFGHDLRQSLNLPVGLIGTYWGGTPAEAWTSQSGLKKSRTLRHYVIDHKKALSSTPPPSVGPNMPTTLFNGMIAPLIPYAMKGVIWYQGESNANRPVEYQTLFARMITDWREKWSEGKFTFLFVQLAGFKADHGQNWALLRESQLKTLSLPNTGMATAVDIGVPNDIHPHDKMDVGDRLALAARHIAYGQELVYSGPIYQAMQMKGNAIQITFTQQGSGLAIGSAPWVPDGFQPLPTEKLLGFTIAGKNKKWVPADARIEGDTVIVSSPEVPNPVAVRYDWANAPQGNLYNKENLPASSFRTDDWSNADVPDDPLAATK